MIIPILLLKKLLSSLRVLLNHINLMRWTEIYNLTERLLLEIDNLGPLRDACLGQSHHGADDIRGIINEKLAEADGSSVNILAGDEGHHTSLDRFRKPHRDVAVGCVVIACDVGHGDRVVDDPKNLLVGESMTECDVRILLQEVTWVTTLRAPLEPIAPDTCLNPTSSKSMARA